jgi:hypothetical protein
MELPKQPQPILHSRRSFLDFSVSGLGAAALMTLLNADRARAFAAEGQRATLPDCAPPAKRVIHISLVGGYSQVDSFDYKPELERLHGKSIPGAAKPDTFFGSAGLLCKSHWRFRQRGECGLWISDLFPHLASVADQLTIINSMVSDTANHTPATFQQLTGFQANGFPSLGSWLSYGLGNESDSLPTFIVLPDARSQPSGGAANWSNGFLPAEHQGTLFHAGPKPIRDLFTAEPVSPNAERDARTLLNRLNRKHAQERRANDLLRARIRAYELAARMQTSVPEAVDFAAEPASIQTLYGIGQADADDCGRRCLLARRLLERGVRFVQIYSGGAFGGKPRHGWDSHENCRVDHSREAARIDQPIAGLIKDLKQRGMLEDTLVLFTTEFGRTPFANAPAGVMALGRDHNPEGFTAWMAGGGLKSGFAYGKTDEIGWKSVEKPVTWPDFHATFLHLMGVDHERLTFYHNGIERRLTNVHGKVIEDLLAHAGRPKTG